MPATVETDTVTASGLDDDGFDVSASDDADVTITDVLPAISLVKTASPLTLPEPGGTFTFSVAVYNDSVEPVVLDSLARRHLRRHHRRGRRHQRHRPARSAAASRSTTATAARFEADFSGNAFDSQTDIVSASRLR